jgi:hypothetical protein
LRATEDARRAAFDARKMTSAFYYHAADAGKPKSHIATHTCSWTPSESY